MIQPRLRAPVRALATAFLLALQAGSAAAQAWPRFRGPAGQGDGSALSLPDPLSRENIRWRTELPGSGQSSPVVWGSRIFLTGYDADSEDCRLVCLATENGERLWTRSLGVQTYGMHDLNSPASTTPAVDASQVAVTWRSGRMLMAAAFEHDGKKLWQVPLGRSTAQHGGGASPVLIDGVLLITNDTEGPSASFLAGLEAGTGRLLWKLPRQTTRASFATPAIYIPQNGPTEAVIASTAHGFTGIDPKDGEILWERTDVFKPRCVASPALAGSIVFATAGSGGGGKVGVALDLARRDEDGNPRQHFLLRRGLPYVPTPVGTGERLYLWSDGGVVSCIDVADGSEIWRERVGGTFYGSPVLVDGRLFAMSTSGELVWVRASDRFEGLGRLDLQEGSSATPAVAGGALLLRTETHLLSLGSVGD